MALRVGVFGMGLALSACATEGPTSPQACSPTAYRALVGQNIGAVSLPAELPQRVITPGNDMQPPRDPRRLNIFVDEKGWILRTACG